MAEDKETVNLEDLVYAEMIQSEAIIRLLVAGIQDCCGDEYAKRIHHKIYLLF